MFSTDFIFRQQENLVDNQKCQAGFRPLCNKILFPTALSIVAYSPLGNPRRPWAKPKDPVIVKDKLLRQIGAKFGGKTAAQIALKYSVRHPHSMAKGNLNKTKNTNLPA